MGESNSFPSAAGRVQAARTLARSLERVRVEGKALVVLPPYPTRLLPSHTEKAQPLTHSNTQPYQTSSVRPSCQYYFATAAFPNSHSKLRTERRPRTRSRRLARRPSVCHSPSSSFCYVDQRRTRRRRRKTFN